MTMFDVNKCYGSFATEPDTAYFWSGLGPNGADIAANIAQDNNGITLEQLMERNKDTLISAGFPYDEDLGGFYFSKSNENDWQAVSQAYAEQASGNVHAVLGDHIRDESVWNTREFPTLKENGNVSSIMSVDPSTRKEKSILYENPNAVCGPSLQDLPPIQPPYNSLPTQGDPDGLSPINKNTAEAINAPTNAAESGQRAAKSLTGGIV